MVWDLPSGGSVVSDRSSSVCRESRPSGEVGLWIVGLLPIGLFFFRRLPPYVSASYVTHQLNRGALLHYSDTTPRGIETVDDGRPGGSEGPLREVDKVGCPGELPPDRLPEVIDRLLSVWWTAINL